MQVDADAVLGHDALWLGGHRRRAVGGVPAGVRVRGVRPVRDGQLLHRAEPDYGCGDRLVHDCPAGRGGVPAGAARGASYSLRERPGERPVVLHAEQEGVPVPRRVLRRARGPPRVAEQAAEDRHSHQRRRPPAALRPRRPGVRLGRVRQDRGPGGGYDEHQRCGEELQPAGREVLRAGHAQGSHGPGRGLPLRGGAAPRGGHGELRDGAGGGRRPAGGGRGWAAGGGGRPPGGRGLRGEVFLRGQRGDCGAEG
mmetsp:Transcript_37255/g.97154  ORF Transcript_37255/g.97154 Transcript_37255/m.97154 type:complete len:254 (+) Transcript_37255:931-1692(+)